MMVNKKLFIVPFLMSCLLLFCSCGSSLTKDEFVKWSRSTENGFYKEKTIGNQQVCVQLVPNELLKAPTGIQKATFNITLKSSDDKLNLREILTEKYGNTIKKYFAFDVEKDIKLDLNGEKVQPEFCHYEQGTDLAKDYRFVVAFDVVADQTMTLTINSKYLETGILKFKFTQEDLLRKPKIKS